MNEEVWFPNKRGLKLSGALHLPRESGKRPAIVVLHGFTGFKDENHIAAFATELASLGFIALRFDASGFGYSEGTPEKDFRASNYLDDVDVAISFLLSRADVDPERIGICGHSFGGGLSVIATAKSSMIKACGAVQPSPVTWVRGCGHDLNEWKKSGWMELETSHPRYKNIRLPWDFVVDRNRHDAVTSAAELKVSLMVMYGTKDQTVDPENSIAIFENAKCSKELLPLEGYDHDFGSYPDQLKYVCSKLGAFFVRELL